MIVNPGYVNTNVSKNALIGDGTKSFGKTDTNIAQGMTIEEHSDIVAEAIYYKKDDVWASKGLKL